MKGNIRRFLELFRHEESCSNENETRMLLTPHKIDKNDPSYYAVEDLKFALSQKGCNNIAVTGGFGSGKSSVINTFIEEEQIEEDVLKISLSTFQQETTQNNDDKDYSDVEYKIVQHLLYKTERSKTPFSRFKLINHVSGKRLCFYAFLVVMALVSYIAAFEPKTLQVESVYTAYYQILGQSLGEKVNIYGDILAVAYLFIFVGIVARWGISRIGSIKSFSFKAEPISMELSENSSVFNKLLDEIVYILRANSYNYIVFEDLDRLANARQLFLKIRELNMLINESEAFRRNKKTIRFIYAIKDDVFTRELRTKCFDYIVAVLPVVDFFNVNDYLISEYKSKGLFDKVSIAELDQLTSRIVDLRELKNIMNEYSLYKRSFQKHLSEDTDSYEKKLLAMVVYKNLFPDDFSKLYKKSGLLYRVIDGKKTFCDELTSTKRDDLEKVKTTIKEAKDKIEGIRKRYLDKLNDEVTIEYLTIKQRDYTLQEVASNDRLFELFMKDGFDSYTYRDHDSDYQDTSLYRFKFKEIQEKLEDEMGYEEAVHEYETVLMKETAQRNKLEKEIKTIENTVLSEVFKQLGGEKSKSIVKSMYDEEYATQLSQATKGKSLEGEKKQSAPEPKPIEMVDVVQTFVFNGYIEEDYYQYISKFYPGTLTEKDYQFKNALLQGIERPYSQPLDNPGIIVEKLRVDDFRNKSILNYDILDYLINNKNEVFLSAFVGTARHNPIFIASYYNDNGKASSEFMRMVFDGWDHCIHAITPVLEENDETLLKLFFMESPTNVVLDDEEIDYLNGCYGFIDKHYTELSVAKLKRLSLFYTLRFKELRLPTETREEFYHYCIDYSLYQINRNNLEVIFGTDFHTKSMSSIMNHNNEHVWKNMTRHIGEVAPFFSETSNDETKAAMTYIIEESGLDLEWIEQYVNRQKLVFDNLEGIKTEGVNLLIRKDKVEATWENVMTVFELNDKKVGEELLEFIKQHADELEGQACEEDDDRDVELHTALFRGDTLSVENFCKLIKSFNVYFELEDFQTITEKERVSAILQQKLTEYDSSILDYFDNTYTKELTADYVIMFYDDILADSAVDMKIYVNNVLCIKVLNSELDLEKKGNYLLAYADIDTTKDDASYLAGMICQFYLTHGFGMGVRQEFLVKALRTYRDENDWFLKIRLINKYNTTMTYDKDYEKELIDTLGGEYKKLNTLYGRAKFDINEENESLLSFLKEKGHYVNDYNVKFDEKENVDKYFVSFKNSMPGEYVNTALV